MRVTKLRNAQGELVVVPNSAMRQVTNLSKDWSRAVIDVPVAMTEDLGAGDHLLKEVVAKMADDPLGTTCCSALRWSPGWRPSTWVCPVRLIARTLPGRQFEFGREIRLAGDRMHCVMPALPRRRSTRPLPGRDERPTG